MTLPLREAEMHHPHLRPRPLDAGVIGVASSYLQPGPSSNIACGNMVTAISSMLDGDAMLNSVSLHTLSKDMQTALEDTAVEALLSDAMRTFRPDWLDPLLPSGTTGQVDFAAPPSQVAIPDLSTNLPTFIPLHTPKKAPFGRSIRDLLCSPLDPTSSPQTRTDTSSPLTSLSATSSDTDTSSIAPLLTQSTFNSRKELEKFAFATISKTSVLPQMEKKHSLGVAGMITFTCRNRRGPHTQHKGTSCPWNLSALPSWIEVPGSHHPAPSSESDYTGSDDDREVTYMQEDGKFYKRQWTIITESVDLKHNDGCIAKSHAIVNKTAIPISVSSAVPAPLRKQRTKRRYTAANAKVKLQNKSSNHAQSYQLQSMFNDPPTTHNNTVQNPTSYISTALSSAGLPEYTPLLSLHLRQRSTSSHSIMSASSNMTFASSSQSSVHSLYAPSQSSLVAEQEACEHITYPFNRLNGH